VVTGRRHLTRHDMKQDEFVSWLTRATVWFEQNSRTVMIGVGALLAAIAVVAGLFTWQRSRTERAFTMLGEVQQAAQLPLAGQPGAGAGAPSTPADRSMRVVEAADRMLKTHGRGDAATWARYHRSAALLDLGRKDDAAAEIETVLDRAEKGSLLEGLARLLAGRVDEARGNYAKAAEHYAAAASAAGPSFPPEMALFDQARCLQAMGSRQEAINALQKIVDLYPDSPLLARANQRLQELRTTSPGS